MVELVHAGRSPEKLAEEFEPTAQSIRNWVAQAPITMRAGVPTALTTTEREELERLRRENRQLKLSGREARMVVFEFIEGLLQSHAAGHSSIGLYGILSGQLEHRFSPIDFERHLPASPDAHQHAVVLAAVKDKPFGRPKQGRP